LRVRIYPVDGEWTRGLLEWMNVNI